MRPCPDLLELDELDLRPHASTDFKDPYQSRITDTQYMMEALHGTSAPMACVAIACDRMIDGDSEGAVFWMRVYRALLVSNPMAQHAGMHIH